MRKTASLFTAAALAAGTALAPLPASAAGTPVSELSTGDAEELCSMLDEQFQFTMKFKSDLPYSADARALHESGLEKCEGGNPAEGVADLRKSLRTMHVVPSTL